MPILFDGLISMLLNALKNSIIARVDTSNTPIVNVLSPLNTTYRNIGIATNADIILVNTIYTTLI
jgi:hypothetical protein